jgi:hypothetical protein
MDTKLELTQIYKPDEKDDILYNRVNICNNNKYNINNKRKWIFICLIIIILIAIGLALGIYFGKNKSNSASDIHEIKNIEKTKTTFIMSSTLNNNIPSSTVSYISTCKFEGTTLGIAIYPNCKNSSLFKYPLEKDCNIISTYNSLEYSILDTQQLHFNFYSDNSCKNILKQQTSIGLKTQNKCVENFFESEIISMRYYCTV